MASENNKKSGGTKVLSDKEKACDKIKTHLIQSSNFSLN
jgi:hypothetical protein